MTRRIVVDAGALERLVRAAVAHQSRTRVLDPELQAAIAALLTGSKPAPPERAALSIAEYAARVGVSERTVQRRLADGSLPSVRLGRRVLIPVSAATSRQETTGDDTGVAPLARRRDARSA